MESCCKLEMKKTFRSINQSVSQFIIYIAPIKAEATKALNLKSNINEITEQNNKIKKQ